MRQVQLVLRVSRALKDTLDTRDFQEERVLWDLLEELDMEHQANRAHQEILEVKALLVPVVLLDYWDLLDLQDL